MNHAYLLIDVFLNGIVVVGIHLIKVDGVIDVCPHIVVFFDVVLKTLQHRVQAASWLLIVWNKYKVVVDLFLVLHINFMPAQHTFLETLFP